MRKRTTIQEFITDGNDKDWWAYVDDKTRRRLQTGRSKTSLRTLKMSFLHSKMKPVQLRLFRKNIGRK